MFTEFTETHRRLGDPFKLGIGLEFLGRIHERQNQFPAALEKYREALGLLRQYGSPQDVENICNDIARVEAKLRGE